MPNTESSNSGQAYPRFTYASKQPQESMVSKCCGAATIPVRQNQVDILHCVKCGKACEPVPAPKEGSEYKAVWGKMFCNNCHKWINPDTAEAHMKKCWKSEPVSEPASIPKPENNKNPYHHDLAKTPMSPPEYFVPGCLACAWQEGFKAGQKKLPSDAEIYAVVDKLADKYYGFAFAGVFATELRVAILELIKGLEAKS